MPRRLKPSPAAVAFILAAVACAVPALAQQARKVPQAFAVVQAPEEAVETCHSTSAQAALDCARKRCERKASRGSCFAVTLCEPSGWAGLMGVQLTEVHFTTAVCGAPTQEALLASLKAFCLGQSGLKQCSVSRIFGPDGKPSGAKGEWSPADVAK